MKRKNIITFFFFINLCIGPAFLEAGFGWLKSTVDTRRKIPPAINMSGSYTLIAPRTDFGYDWAYLKIRKSLSDSIAIHNPDLKFDPEHPQYTINIIISEYNLDQAWKSEKIKKEEKIKCDANDHKEKNNCTREIKEIRMYLNVEGELVIDYELINNKKRHTAYSSSAHAVYNDKFEFGTEPPSLRQVEDMLVQNIIDQILPQITFTYQKLSIPLAKGKDGEFKDGNEYAQKWRWNEAIQKWQEKQKQNEPESKSNLLYNIAIAHECMASSQNSSDEILNHLNTALNNLQKAINTFPSENIYYEAQERIAGYKNQWESYLSGQD